MVKCPSCGAGADLTKDGEWAHCASCNNIFQPKDVESKVKEGESTTQEAEKKESEGQTEK